jgi:hypothetical protein
VVEGRLNHSLIDDRKFRVIGCPFGGYAENEEGSVVMRVRAGATMLVGCGNDSFRELVRGGFGRGISQKRMEAT